MNTVVYLAILLLACWLAYVLRFDALTLASNYLIALLIGLLLAAILLPATGAFRQELRWALMRRTRRLIAGWAVVVVAMVALAAMFKVTATYSRVWFGYWVLLGTAGLVLGEVVGFQWHKRLHRLMATSRRLVLVGSGEAARRVEQRLANDGSWEFELVARFGKAWSDQATLPLEGLAAYVEEHPVDDVWIAAPLSDAKLLEQALEALKEAVVNVHVVPDLEQYRMLNQQVYEWSGLPVVNLSGTPMTGAEWRLKSALDRIVAALLVLLLSPLLLLIALFIRFTSSGPVLFRQPRHGIGGEPIEVYKFRTMKLHREPEGSFTQAQPDDERVTPIGRMLRRSSLDELPQLFNVLKGDMSLVGPRPHPVPLDGAFRSRIPRYMLRNKVKPGITGWAQIHGLRGITDTDEKMALRIEHDLWYIQNWSLWLDLRILLQTPLAMLHRNAF